MKILSWVLLSIVLFSYNPVLGQAMDFQSEIKRIQDLILNDQLQQADSILQLTVDQAISKKDFPRLSKLIYWTGKVELALNENKSLSRSIELSNFISKNTKDPISNYQSYLDLSRLYNEKGDLNQALELGKKAVIYALEIGSKDALANCYYYLGEYNLRLGNIDPFFENIKKGHQILLKNPRQKFQISARILNYMGAIKYFSSEPDSAYYFYNQALEKVGQMEDNLENRLYFPAAINANMVLLKQSQNEFEEALTLAEECIVLNKRFLASSKKHPLRFRSQRNLSLAYRNLCSLYEQIGDYNKSYQIAEIAYEHGKRTFEPQLLEYFSAMTLFAEAKILKRDFDGALKLMEEAKKSLDASPGENPLLQANYSSILGSAFYGKGDYENAKAAYDKSNEMHRTAQNGLYSSDHLFVIINLALCHAQLEESEAAYKILDEAYHHQIETNNQGRLIDVLLMAKARAADILKDSEQVKSATAIFLSKNADTILNDASYAFKAEAIALNSKSKYELQGNLNMDFLKDIDSTMNEAIGILEKRMAFIGSEENINSLISENDEIFDLAKKINLDLYRLSQDDNYLINMIGLHESAIYHKIRSRLNLKNAGNAFKLPTKINEREKNLKKALQKPSNDFDSFYEANNNWMQFLDSLKIQYPKYYQMRYANLLVPLERLQENIPSATTIIRYLYVDQDLYAYVASNENQTFVPLESIEMEDINTLGRFENDADKFVASSNNLYKVLWEPLAELVQTKNVIIFPDGQLFNLSFELLTSEKIKGFEEFADHALLAKHHISYNYSLALLDSKQDLFDFENHFVAFAPSFTEKMKADYTLAINDSINLDKTYLTLLPQPFSSTLVKKFEDRFSGKTFLNDNASKQVFKNSANEHKIIHIGTHAESNNINPELSRLIFAKNVSDSTNINDNSLYTYEIYNQNLNSNLAILTACETGKPSYQPGEGMISLAHAFNYAGSESILTSLWQIDEQSSSEILEFFYEYLEDGKGKDEALSLAKLDYLKSAEGRTLHPQYWAGLILMGDASPIALKSSTQWWIWILVGLIVITLATLYLRKRKAS